MVDSVNLFDFSLIEQCESLFQLGELFPKLLGCRPVSLDDFRLGAFHELRIVEPPFQAGQLLGRLLAFALQLQGTAFRLALLHGSQPDVVVVCHEQGRERMLGHTDYLVPSLEESIDLVLRLGARTNPAIRCAGVSLNTGKLGEAEAHRAMGEIAARLGLPAADPIPGGEAFARLVDACLA